MQLTPEKVNQLYKTSYKTLALFIYLYLALLVILVVVVVMVVAIIVVKIRFLIDGIYVQIGILS